MSLWGFDTQVDIGKKFLSNNYTFKVKAILVKRPTNENEIIQTLSDWNSKYFSIEAKEPLVLIDCIKYFNLFVIKIQTTS